MRPSLITVPVSGVASEEALVQLAVALGAKSTGGPLSAAERWLCGDATEGLVVSDGACAEVRQLIRAGGDPLGDSLCRLRSGAERRRQGAFYTPPAIVRPMVDWVLGQAPQRVVDAGCGSGRFSAELVRRSPDLEIWAFDLDPIQTLISRATLATLGARNAHVVQGDYLMAELPRAYSRTAFISNPPYVRHHDLEPEVKAWGAAAAGKLGHPFSGLAGLHAHFFLATAQLGRPGDVGCFVTSAEWLDVGYGSIIRSLLLDGLGGHSLHVVEPSATAFDDAQTTAVITCFELGSQREALKVRRVGSPQDLEHLELGRAIAKAAFAKSSRWTPLTKQDQAPDGREQRLGDVVKVHRGMVTGANDYFVLPRERAAALGLLPWCVPAITDGKEILQSSGVVRDQPGRKVLLRIPRDIDRQAFPALDAYLRLGETPAGDPRAIANRYISSHRRPWWYLGPPEPPPIIASYMARQPPLFAVTPDGLALINIAHGLYPKRPMAASELEALVASLNKARHSFRGRGRTYQGGLEKFEPREMEALPLRIGNG